MSPSPPSPRVFRILLWVAIGLGALVSLSAAQESAVAMSVEGLSPKEVSLGPLAGVLSLSKEQLAALRAQERATLSAIESMAVPRAVVLGFLAASTLVVFVTALQIRWSPETPPASLARRMGTVAIASAILRTLDGAQQLVIVRRAAEANGRALLGSGTPDIETAIGVTRALVSVVSVGWTALIVGLFVVLGTYFRSPKVLGVFAPDSDRD